MYLHDKFDDGGIRMLYGRGGHSGALRVAPGPRDLNATLFLISILGCCVLRSNERQ